MRFLPLIMLAVILQSCASAPPLPVVKEVELARYTGQWYEIARFPHFFEKNLDCVSATYTLRPDGRITVLNKGRKISDPTVWKSVQGIAWIPDEKEPAKLRVRFFWPFYGSYWILDLDGDYQWALVGHPSRNYLWILSREKTMETERYNALTRKARELGFDTDKLEKVNQDCE